MQLGCAVHSTTQKSTSHQKYEDCTRDGEDGFAHPGENFLPERETMSILSAILCLCLLANLLKMFSKVDCLQVDTCLCV